jgi:ferritin-like metal-binding protein YciE
MEMQSLEDLMSITLQELYGAEMQELQQAGPEMAKAVSNPQLFEAVSQHPRETEHQVQRLERVMQKMGVAPTPCAVRLRDPLYVPRAAV